jgi:hypothetical protein
MVLDDLAVLDDCRAFHDVEARDVPQGLRGSCSLPPSACGSVKGRPGRRARRAARSFRVGRGRGRGRGSGRSPLKPTRSAASHLTGLSPALTPPQASRYAATTS